MEIILNIEQSKLIRSDLVYDSCVPSCIATHSVRTKLSHMQKRSLKHQIIYTHKYPLGLLPSGVI